MQNHGTMSGGKPNTNGIESKESSHTSGVVTQAEQGFMTGADDYEKVRPGYTEATVDYIVSEATNLICTGDQGFRTGIQYNVVELGSGTGKMTELLIKKLPQSAKYLAVEPSAEFHNLLLSKKLNVEAVVGSSAAIPCADQAVENVVCAQSFHWFSDSDNLKEIRRVLIPGGNLIIVINMKDFQKDWMTIFYEQRKELCARAGDSSLSYLVSSMAWQRDIQESPLFALKAHRLLPGVELRGDLEKILHTFSTASAYTRLPAEERALAVDEARQKLLAWPGLDPNDMQIPFSSEIYIYTAL